MLQRLYGSAGRLGVLAVFAAAAALVVASADAAAASVNVPCAGGAGLVAAVNTVRADDDTPA